MKRILNYPGSKWTMADLIIDNMPSHKSYLEPFFGSGAVFFTKERDIVETINDLNCRLVNFFEVCRSQPRQLAEAIYLTPISRFEQQESLDIDPDPLEDARKFLVLSWQSIGGIQRHLTGWRSNITTYGSKTINEWTALPDLILEVANRLKMAQIENQDALQLLQRYDRKDVFAYVDPPYLLSTRKGRYYQTELEDERQPELLEILKKFSGKIMLSGYDNDLYNDQLSDWWKLEFQSNAEAGERRIETIWCNYEPSGKLSLFG